MAIPAVIVEAAFADDPFEASPTWTDISAYVYSVQINRGRSSERDVFNPGTATIRLDNSIDGRFDANNTSGAYYSDHALGGIRKSVRVRIRESTNSQTLIVGWAESWVQTYMPPAGAVTTLRIVDILGLIASISIPATTQAAEVTTDRVADVLDRAGVPSGAGWRDLATSEIEMTATTYATTVRAHLSTVETTEGGAVWVQKDGVIRFDDRYSIFTDSNQSTPQVVFDDADPGASGVVRFSQPSLVTDDRLLATDVTATRTDPAYTTTASNTAAATAYGASNLTVACEATLDARVEANAEWYLGQYSTIRPRLPQLTIEPLTAGDDAYDAATNSELRDRVTVNFTPPGGGDRFAGDHFIEAISHDIDAQAWVTTLGVSTVDRFAEFDYSTWVPLFGSGTDFGDGKYFAI